MRERLTAPQARRENCRFTRNCRVNLCLGDVGRFAQVRSLQVCALKNGVFQVCHPEVGIAQIGPAQIGSHEIGDAEVGAFEFGVLEVGIMEVGFLQHGIGYAESRPFLARGADPLIVHRKHFF